MSTHSLKPTIYQAAERNKGPILDVLKSLLRNHFGERPFQQKNQTTLNCLEIGSASGQHLAHFSQCFPGIQFQPSDVDRKLFDSINSFKLMNKLDNLLEPIILNLNWPPLQWPSPEGFYDIVYCSNVVHISPWKCSIGLFDGVGRCLKRPNGLLIMYGPFAVNGELTPQSNIDFDRLLRQQDSEFGIRDTRKLNELAHRNGLKLQQIINMPANNKILTFHIDI